MKILTGTQHAELDRYTIENEPIESIELMERAAQAITLEIMSRWDKERNVFVFAGAGNNGGDGLAVARKLVEEGYNVNVHLFNIKGKLSEECETNRDRLQNILDENRDGGRLAFNEISEGFDFPKITRDDIVIDALFGTGLSNPLTGGFAVVAKKINSLHAHVVSIDIPSGLMCENNAFTDRSVVIHAELTLSIQLPKLAFVMADNEKCVGEWKLLDIGLSEDYIEDAETPYYIVEEGDVKELRRHRSKFAHKGTLGHALIVAGSYGMAGAAILASKACLRSGLGKLTVHTTSSNNTIMQTTVPEAVLLLDKSNRCITENFDISNFKVIGIGSGLGQDSATAISFQQYLAISDNPMVIDADALNILGNHRDWLSHIPTGSILTPHAKELDGIMGHCSNSYERLSHAIELANQYRVYVILKGHYTAICTPQGKVLFCPRGNAGMATPGSGDVLTGILTGLLAQGYSPGESAVLGVWLHATAGDYAAEELGQEFMLSSDIISYMSKSWKSI